jgi:hypothetical protein
MFNFFDIDISRIATAALGALVLSTTFVAAAVGPARAVETSTIAVAQAGATGQAIA